MNYDSSNSEVQLPEASLQNKVRFTLFHMHGFPVQKRSQEQSSDRTAPKPVAAEEPGGHTHSTAHTSRDKAYLVSHLRGQYLPSFNFLNGFPSVDGQ